MLHLIKIVEIRIEPNIISSHLNDVSDVDDERIRDWFDPDPLTISLPIHIKSTNNILSKDSKSSGIFVGTNAKNEFRCSARRVVVETNEAGLVFEEVIQPSCQQLQARRDELKQLEC